MGQDIVQNWIHFIDYNSTLGYDITFVPYVPAAVFLEVSNVTGSSASFAWNVSDPASTINFLTLYASAFGSPGFVLAKLSPNTLSFVSFALVPSSSYQFWIAFTDSTHLYNGKSNVVHVATPNQSYLGELYSSYSSQIVVLDNEPSRISSNSTCGSSPVPAVSVPSASIKIQDVLCNGQATGSISFAPSGGVVPVCVRLEQRRNKPVFERVKCRILLVHCFGFIRLPVRCRSLGSRA